MKILFGLQPGTFDLHMHTTSSDGVYAPADLVQKCRDAGLATIAVTDHDTLGGIAEAQAAGETLGVRVIAGVEISTKHHGQNVHVLGYGMERLDFLHQSLASVRDDREWRAKQIIEKFCSLGLPLTLDDVLEFSQGAPLARPHIARAVVKKGYLPDLQTVFDKYLADGMPCDVEKQVFSPQEAVALIHEAGGQAVLAHPVYIEPASEVEAILKQGFDGVEVWHRSHAAEDAKRFQALAEKLGLAMSGGSDFHFDDHELGNFMPPLY